MPQFIFPFQKTSSTLKALLFFVNLSSLPTYLVRPVLRFQLPVCLVILLLLLPKAFLDITSIFVETDTFRAHSVNTPFIHSLFEKNWSAISYSCFLGSVGLIIIDVVLQR